MGDLHFWEPCVSPVAAGTGRGSDVTRLHQATDRIYTAPAPYSCLRELDFDRRLSLWHRAYSDVVLWNPWQALPDAPSTQWREFVCLETARISRPLNAGSELAVEIVDV
jgi:D-hexose-6-phosphate mutarotase